MKKNILFLFCGLLVQIPAMAQKITPVYNGTLRYNSTEKLDLVKKEFTEMLNKVYYVNIGKSARPRYIPEDQMILVEEDKISFNVAKKELFSIPLTEKWEINIQEYSYLGKVYQLILPGLTLYWKIKDLEFAQRFADDLVYFQNMKDFVRVKDIADFESIAAKYRALKIKPEVSEEARKYMVQANLMTQSRDYKKAVELYDKALEIDPANPIVYNNQALLFAMLGKFDEAINRMKKYLKLVPEASDARAAQDKIYEWETK